VLDEMHHCEKDGLWAKAIAPLVELAAFKVYMTGTIQRGDGGQIAFIDYDSNADGNLVPVMTNSATTKIIEYTRTDALMEKAIIPLQFHLHDGFCEWQDEEGRTRKESLGEVADPDAGAALYTALATEYADELLGLAYSHWIKHCYTFPGSKLLIVTASLEHAKAACDFFTRKRNRFALATSHDSASAQDAIRQFKGRGLDILVSISMAYEGLDVPGISHIACLTHIRSEPWISQMIGRAVRVDPRFPYESQTGFIFAPDDPFFRKIVKAINAEQLPIAKAASEKAAKGTQKGLFGEEREFDNIYKITPIGSRLTGQRELRFSGCTPVAAIHNEPPVKTPSEIEVDLLVAIESHVRAYCFANRYNPKKINTEIKQEFGGKPRALMHTEELDRVYAHLLERYPLNSIRGTGIPRCPTKAAPWP
jgi:superfamily II DNA or RNA helicase